MSDDKKDIFGWWKSKKKTFDVDQVQDLVNQIKVFNAGCIDEYLSNHVDKVFKDWLVEHSDD